jgi:hypothetical protein
MRLKNGPVPYPQIGALIRKFACAGADDCAEIPDDKGQRVFHRFYREFVIYLSALAVDAICTNFASVNGHPAVLETLRESIVFGKEPDERIRSLLCSTIAAVAIDERFLAYFRGDLDELGISQSVVECLAERGAPKPEDNRASNAYYGFVVMLCRLERGDYAIIPAADQFASFEVTTQVVFDS